MVFCVCLVVFLFTFLCIYYYVDQASDLWFTFEGGQEDEISEGIELEKIESRQPRVHSYITLGEGRFRKKDFFLFIFST